MQTAEYIFCSGKSNEKQSFVNGHQNRIFIYYCNNSMFWKLVHSETKISLFVKYL